MTPSFRGLGFPKWVSKEIVHLPKVVFVRRTVREKYACPKCHDGVLTAEGPEEVLDRGMFDRSFLAGILVAKYKDNLPLYRQAEMYKRDGIDLPLSTLCDQGPLGLTEEAATSLRQGAQIHSIQKTPTEGGQARFDTEKNERHQADKFWALALAVRAVGLGKERRPRRQRISASIV